MISIPKADLLARRQPPAKSEAEVERDRLRTELLRRIVARETRRRSDRTQ